MFSKALVIIKPDAIARKLVGRIFQRLEDKGLFISAMRMEHLSWEQAKELYKEHKNKEWFTDQLKFMTSGRVILMKVMIPHVDADASMVIRNLMGDYGPYGQPGTIRGDFGLGVRMNLIHCSDSKEAAERELEIFFGNETEVKNTDLPV